MSKDYPSAMDCPEVFYKYRSMDGESSRWVERTIVHSEIFFSPAAKLNDPFELKPPFSFDAPSDIQQADYERLSRKFEPDLSELDRITESQQVMSQALSKDNLASTEMLVQFAHGQYMANNVGIFCVSTKRDDILMWSHYGNSHSGVCLEFDGLQKLMRHAQKVNYVDERVPISVYTDDQISQMEKALLTKSSLWKYEDEWRLIRYEHGPGVVQFRPKNLTGVILGALASIDTTAKIKRWVSQARRPIKIYRAVIDSKKYALKIKLIS